MTSVEVWKLDLRQAVANSCKADQQSLSWGIFTKAENNKDQQDLNQS